MRFQNVLIVDDDDSMRHMLTVILKDRGYEVRGVPGAEEGLKEIEARDYDVVLSDVRMPKMDGIALLKEIHRRQPELTVVVMSAYGTTDTAITAMKEGAYDYISKPFKPDEVVLVLRKAEERERLKRENERLRGELSRAFRLESLVGTSPPMQEVARQIRKVAQVKTTVLVSGESGTGKELVARALHDLSPRAAMPFVAVNCGAIPGELMESELFGHVRGAFTDAVRNKKGLFSEADGGTLFLDEVGELPQQLQVKLLRVLQEEEIRRVGDSRSEKVDVRVIAATKRDLPQQVARGAFREDLYYRLNVLNLRLPPLRERKDDLELLARHFIAKYNARLGRRIGEVAPDALQLMHDYAWPGNVRELENAIERAMVLCDGEIITLDLLPELVLAPKAGAAAAGGAQGQAGAPAGGDLSIKKASRALEEDLIRRALQKTRGNRTRAAELLEISHRALLYKVKEYGIDPDLEGAKGAAIA
ncbi:MAG: sigma-54-dependent Fis family transcriptional regulator [Deltaproteobacteria bacterium]|nr:sigma-54-dependent Fis family transcriptional regulator [Deltaproteobacteria bacterium]